MCESESGFGFESGFKAFLAGFRFGFGFRPQKGESGFGFKKKRVDWIRIRIRIRTDWIRIRIWIQENRGGFGFVWIRIRGVWIRIRIRIQDVQIRTSLVHICSRPQSTAIQGDNELESVCLSICLTFERKVCDDHYQFEKIVCVFASGS